MSIFGYVLDSLYKTIYAFHVSTTPSIINKMLSGDRPSLSRLISMIENDHPDTALIMKEVMPHTGRAHIIGITGFAGAGKSTIIDRLTASYRMDGLLVGIIAVDPSSPLSGGQFLATG
jgi:LAO/AO transport system kinase